MLCNAMRMCLVVVFLLFLHQTLSFNIAGSSVYARKSSISLKPPLEKRLQRSSRLYSGKSKDIFFCSSCGAESLQWKGKCNNCGEWDTIQRFRTESSQIGAIDPRGNSNAWTASAKSFQRLSDIDLNETIHRIPTRHNEVNRVLGGGLVPGGVVLLAGDPGIGKSTLLLQIAGHFGTKFNSSNVVYITGEETPTQVALRAKRLNLTNASNIDVYAETNMNNIMQKLQEKTEKPSVIVVDSIQTMLTENGTPGSATSMKESTLAFIRFAKTYNSAVLLAGHVTKTGDIFGPKLLEHMVDTVLQFENIDTGLDQRILRSTKNRFGPAQEIGLLQMTSKGIEESDSLDLSSIQDVDQDGSCFSIGVEGSRPFLIEVQAIAGISHYNPAVGKGVFGRRVSEGFSTNRLVMLTNVIEKRLKMFMYSRDIFVNVVGGIKLSTEANLDLAVATAIISNVLQVKVMPSTVVIGELGLTGAVKPVRNIATRIAEAKRRGIQHIIVPPRSSTNSEDPSIVEVSTLKDAVMKALGILNIDTHIGHQKSKFKTNPEFEQ